MSNITLIPSTTITTAVAGTVTLHGAIALTDSLLLEAVFTYGSGGTTAIVLVETSLDNANWIEIASFDFATATGRKLFNLSSLTSVGTSYVSSTALAANTSKDGIIGRYLRATLTTTGTYAASTTIQLKAITR